MTLNDLIYLECNTVGFHTTKLGKQLNRKAQTYVEYLQLSSLGEGGVGLLRIGIKNQCT